MLFGLFILSIDSGVQGTLLRWWPIILIVLGGVLGWQAYSRQPSTSRLPVNTAPKLSPTKEVTESEGAAQTGITQGVLGEYSVPAPGASVEILPDYDEAQK